MNDYFNPTPDLFVFLVYMKIELYQFFIEEILLKISNEAYLNNVFIKSYV